MAWATGQELLSLKEVMNNAVFSPDKHRLAGGASDGTVTIWDATPLPAQP